MRDRSEWGVGVWAAGLSQVALVALAAGCGSSVADATADAGDAAGDSAPPVDAGSALPLGDAWVPDDQPPLDASKPAADGGGYAQCDGGVLAADRFATRVVSFTPGDCAGFGVAQMPAIVLGPPVGAGDGQGGLDVVSLGSGGTIVLSFEPNAIIDGPGVDFIVFENAFFAAGNPDRPSAEVGEVSVSDDGVTWTVFPCTSTKAPFGTCAGWHPVYSSPRNCISPVDPAVAGGDAFDLAAVGVTHARYVRVIDRSMETCPTDPSQKLTSNGFDLDAVSIVNAEHP
jgi:hypothetical protein